MMVLNYVFTLSFHFSSIISLLNENTIRYVILQCSHALFLFSLQTHITCEINRKGNQCNREMESLVTKASILILDSFVLHGFRTQDSAVGRYRTEWSPHASSTLPSISSKTAGEQ